MSNTLGTVMIDIKADTSHLIKSTEKAQKYMQKSMNSMKKTVLGLAAGYIGVQTAIKGMEIALRQAQQMINVAASFEKFNATLKTIEGSSVKAQKSMKWIEDFAASTPFNIDKVTSSFISLRSYGLDPTDGLLRTLGDTGAAMGKDIQQAVEAMADAVVGENERLKEFGVRASKMGEQIKYSWTNASGEMRQSIIQNNSEIIESTLSSIFNSKYAGAMEEQSKTWNGLISNMQDNWTIFQKNLMDSGIFDYLKAIVTVVGESLSGAFGNTLESSATFSMYVIDGIKAIISSIGYTFDALETFGDYFVVIGLTAELAFEGIMVAVIGLGSGIVNIFENIIDGINRGFETLVNGVIASINGVLDIAASLGVGSGGNIGTVNLGNVDVGGDFLKGYSDAADKVFIQTSKDLGLAWDDLMDANSGQTFVDDMLNKIDIAYEKIQNTPEITVEKADFGDAVTTSTDKDIIELEKYQVVVDDIAVSTDDLQSTTDKINDTFTDFNDTLLSDTNENDTYTVVNTVNDSFNNLNDTTSQTVDAIDEVSQALDTFIFKFEDTFLNSIETNIAALSSIGSSSSFNTLSYEDSLSNILSKRDALIANPLDVNIGLQYEEAYGLFLDSASDYLGDMTNFSSQQDFMFAQATVGSQASTFEETAFRTVDVLESMNIYLKTINEAFSDGILTDKEKATIAGVADVVNKKNEILLGRSSVIVAGVNGIPTSLDSQTYYDNTPFAGDTGLLSLVDNQSALLGGNATNSITDVLGSLYSATGDGTYDMNSMTAAIVKATGLTSDNISNFLEESGTTAVTTPTITPTTPTVTAHWVPGHQEVTSVYVLDKAGYTSSLTGQYVPATYHYEDITRWVDGYNEYYAAGGFTGSGMGQKDSTGFKQAGIVHEDEWVAPKWMVQDNPELFGALEIARLGKNSNIDLGSDNTSINVSKADSSSQGDKYLFVVANEMKLMNSLLKRVTKGGQAMRTEAVL